MQAKYSNVLKLVRNETGYQTSVTYNDFVKNGVVQLAKVCVFLMRFASFVTVSRPAEKARCARHHFGGKQTHELLRTRIAR